jgi:putative peptidoglycan lipid II flippase
VNDSPAGFFALTTEKYNWIYILLMVGLYCIAYSSTNWHLIQKYFCVATERDARKAGWLVVGLNVLGPPLILTPAKGLHIGPFQLPGFGLGLYGIVYGVILGALLHLLIQVPGLMRHGFRWTPVLEVRSAGVQRVLILLGPRVLTMGCIQAYFVARDNLASHFGTSGVGALNLGWTIEQVPETIIGTAMAAAILPTLADFITRGQTAEFTRTVNRALRIMLALGLPAAVLLGFAVRPLAESFFGYDATRLDLVQACTWAFLIGLVGDTWLEVAVRGFYANQNTRTPLIAALGQVSAFVLLSIALSSSIGLTGIPLAASLSFTTQAIILLMLLDRRFRGLRKLGSTTWRALSAGAAAGLVMVLALLFLPFSSILSCLVGLLAGSAAAAPLIWPELRLLLNL